MTISSAEEEQFILEQGRGLTFWMAGWHPTGLGWRDERNRPLRYFGNWGTRQPENRTGETRLALLTGAGDYRGWNDVFLGESFHACIEWGEEYPEDLEADAK